MGDGVSGGRIEEMQIACRNVQLDFATRLLRDAFMGHGHNGAACHFHRNMGLVTEPLA